MTCLTHWDLAGLHYLMTLGSEGILSAQIQLNSLHWTHRITTRVFLPVYQNLLSIELGTPDGGWSCKVLWDDAKLLSSSIKIPDTDSEYKNHCSSWEARVGRLVFSLKHMFANSSEHLVFILHEWLFCVSFIFVVEKKTCQWESVGKVLVFEHFSSSAFSAKQPLWIFDSLKL